MSRTEPTYLYGYAFHDPGQRRSSALSETAMLVLNRAYFALGWAGPLTDAESRTCPQWKDCVPPNLLEFVANGALDAATVAGVADALGMQRLHRVVKAVSELTPVDVPYAESRADMNYPSDGDDLLAALECGLRSVFDDTIALPGAREYWTAYSRGQARVLDFVRAYYGVAVYSMLCLHFNNAAARGTNLLQRTTHIARWLLRFSDGRAHAVLKLLA